MEIKKETYCVIEVNGDEICLPEEDAVELRDKLNELFANTDL